jgi:hypothetical protein
LQFTLKNLLMIIYVFKKHEIFLKTMKIVEFFLIIWGKLSELEPKFLTSWSRSWSRTKVDRLRNAEFLPHTSVNIGQICNLGDYRTLSVLVSGQVLKFRNIKYPRGNDLKKLSRPDIRLYVSAAEPEVYHFDGAEAVMRYRYGSSANPDVRHKKTVKQAKKI